MRAAVVVATLGVLALGAVAGFAQQPPPSVTITASPTTLELSSAGPFQAGPTRFELVRSGGTGDLSIGIAALRPGVTRAQFEATLGTGAESVLELIHLDGGVDLSARDQRRAVTVELRPNATYVVVNLTGDRPQDFEVAEFAVGGQPNGADPPRADASVRIIDLRFRGDSTLPLRGVVRFQNAGWAPHFAIAAPLRRGASTRAVGQALRRNQERRLGRLIDFRSALEAQSLITRGAVDYSELRFPRRGRYVMVCFFENHNAQGMFRFVRVR